MIHEEGREIPQLWQDLIFKGGQVNLILDTLGFLKAQPQEVAAGVKQLNPKDVLEDTGKLSAERRQTLLDQINEGSYGLTLTNEDVPQPNIKPAPGQPHPDKPPKEPMIKVAGQAVEASFQAWQETGEIQVLAYATIRASFEQFRTTMTYTRLSERLTRILERNDGARLEQVMAQVPDMLRQLKEELNRTLPFMTAIKDQVPQLQQSVKHFYTKLNETSEPSDPAEAGQLRDLATQAEMAQKLLIMFGIDYVVDQKKFVKIEAESFGTILERLGPGILELQQMFASQENLNKISELLGGGDFSHITTLANELGTLIPEIERVGRETKEVPIIN